MSRRGNGEGSVRLRSDGRWESRVRLPGGQRVSVYGATRAEVTEAAAKLVRDAKLGVSVVDGRQTLEEWLTRWLEIHSAALADRSVSVYETAARLHIIPVIGSVRLADLAPYHVDRVFARMRAEGLRNFTPVYSVLRSSLHAAVRQGYIVRNVVDLVTRPTDIAGVYEPFTAEQAQRYLAFALDPALAQPAPKGAARLDRYNRPVRLGPLLAVMILTGLRMGEVAGLNWRDIDLAPKKPKRPSLKVVQQVTWKHGDPVFKRPKRDSRRTILLEPRAVEALTRWRKLQRMERLRAGEAWVTSLTCVSEERRGEKVSFEGLVFTDEIGRPLSHMTIQNQHRRLCRLAGLPIVRPHDLRHSFATLMLNANVSAKLVAHMLGHTTVNMTLNRYSHVQPEMLAAAIDQLSQFLAAIEERQAQEERGYADDQSGS